NITAATFSNGVYHLDETELAQGLSLSSHGGGAFDFDVTVTGFDYLKSHQRTPTTALPGAIAGGAGSDAQLDGTGWSTADAAGKWRPNSAHTVGFGAHLDRFSLDNPKF